MHQLFEKNYSRCKDEQRDQAFSLNGKGCSLILFITFVHFGLFLWTISFLLYTPEAHFIAYYMYFMSYVERISRQRWVFMMENSLKIDKVQ